jgi:hypothetical protein
LTKSSQLTIDQDTDITSIGPDLVKLPIQKAALKRGRLELTIDDDRFVLTMEEPNRALLAKEGMRPWHLERTLTAAMRSSRAHWPSQSILKKSAPCTSSCAP